MIKNYDLTEKDREKLTKFWTTACEVEGYIEIDLHQENPKEFARTGYSLCFLHEDYAGTLTHIEVYNYPSDYSAREVISLATELAGIDKHGSILGWDRM